ncbi:MAG: DUF4097 domain-containing protein [Candidatus Aminicenantes bacterium]|nr:DUF4097 domain-containing protein [Candidatus Aminicenantes bacterium]
MHRNIAKTVIFLSLFCFFFGTTILQAGVYQGYDKKEDFLKTLPLDKDGTFSLMNLNGPVTIETWNRDAVEIRAEKAVRGNRENLDKIKIEIDAGSNSIVVNTIFPKIRAFRGKVSYEIKVPEGLQLEKISTVNGNLNIQGPVTDVWGTTTNGDVLISEASGKLVFSTTNGNVKTEDIHGEINARSTNGSIFLEVDSISDEITARTTNGGISLTIDSGDIDADIEARTTNGRVTIDFPVTIQSGMISKRSLDGRIGEGGPLISLKTTNGSIKILK